MAFGSGVWDAAAAERDVPDGTEVVVAFVAARKRDTVAIVACTLDEPHVFPLWARDDGERVDPSDVAEERATSGALYSVRQVLCSEHDLNWVLLELFEEGLPITNVPRSPQLLALQWQQFFVEKRLTHDPDHVLAR